MSDGGATQASPVLLRSDLGRVSRNLVRRQWLTDNSYD